ncbi:unnamed protein product [Phytophthora lilii]|uniref:Unnamed protein product n=1 Tax=Phytophthora lilii TaxID=2077276 RepID=A0A9W6TEG7_9STRA|nr:unnamed protein product [Phytophthora lilii]
MSVLVPSTDDEVLDALDPRYFTETFDPVAHMLVCSFFFCGGECGGGFDREVGEQDNIPETKTELNVFLRTEISAVDVAKDVILTKLQDDVRANYNSLIQGMKVVQEVDLDLIVTLGSQIVQFFEEEEKMNLALQEHRFITAVRSPLLLYIMSSDVLKLMWLGGELLQAYITLADHSENLGFEFSSYTLNEVLSNIPEIIVRSIDDMTSEFMRRVFEAVSPKKLKNGSNAVQIESNNANKTGEPMDITLSPASQTVENGKRCYEHLTDLMHTYYLLVQWHRDPFNPHNDDIAYLHRCGIDDDDDDDDDDSEEDDDHDEHGLRHSHSKHAHGSGKSKGVESPSHRSRNGGLGQPSASQRSLYDQVLCDTGMTLLRYRKIVWENIQKNVLEMVEKLDVTYGNIYWISYGKKNWLRVTASTTDGDDNAGLLRLIEKRSGYFFERKVREDLAVNPIYSRRVFPSFHTEGNPFNAANSMEWLSMKQGIRFHHEAKGAGSFGDAIYPRSIDNQGLPVMDPNESEFVLTSSSLAGFVRLCGVYLKMMEHLPNIGWDVFRSLNNLFEFNLYAVFTTFITADDITQLFRGKGGSLVKSDATRWNGLRAGICRIADEINAGEVLLQSSALIYPSSTDNGRGEQQQQNSPMSRKVTLRKVTRTPSAVEEADEGNLYALAERSVACEAIVGQCRLLNAIEELARSTIATRLVDVPALLDSVSAVSWDIPYISDQHNEYIVHLVQKCGEAWGGLQILADGSIPMDAREDIWAAMVQTIMDTLLQGFSTVSKPTPQGRALMLLDLHALQNGLDLINHISSCTMPRGREYVGNYIKAFYYDENELLEWVKANKVSHIHPRLGLSRSVS